MTSLELIQKVQIREVQGKKPAYRYIGPEIDDVNGIINCGTSCILLDAIVNYFHENFKM